MTGRSKALWTFLVTSLGLFMVVLDNLVVTTALPSIRVDLGASLDDLQWTVSAYTLTFAVLLLTGAALGDRFGRRLMFAVGMGIFTAASAAAALAPSIEALVAARAIQGIGAAIVTPLTLTLLAAAVPAERRGVALGAWSGIAGLAVALGPVVGGAVVDGISWEWVFWINAPIGLVVIPLALARLSESRGPAGRFDLGGVALASAGFLGVVWGLVRGNDAGWGSLEIVGSLAAGAALVAAFVAWERRASSPMLDLGMFRNRAFAVTNGVSLLMYFGMFGSIFLLAQFLQTAQGYSPLGAGLRTLPWTAMPMLVAPLAGALSDRIGGRPLMAAGLGLQAVALGWLAALAAPGVAYGDLVPPFAVAGIGTGLVFAPIANVILSSVRREQEGQASGANNAIRELGGVFGIAVMATVFGSYGGYASPQDFTDGLVPATWVGAAVVGLGALLALAVPRHSTARQAAPGLAPEPARA